MPQGGFKRAGTAKPGRMNKANAAKVKKHVMKKKMALKGNPLKMPKRNTGNISEAMAEKDLSKAIARKSEAGCASKLFQDGGKITIKDTTQAGKEINREKRRDQVKKKLSRIEEKLQVLQKKDAKREILS
jgi:hypothetical protein